MAERRTVRHLERVDWSPHPASPPDLERWPFTIPAVAELIRNEGLEVPPGVTFLIGENGTGKSTLIEALSSVYPRAGFASPFTPSGPGPSEEDSELPRHLRVRTNPLASPAGFFLRAEAMHSYFATIDADPSQARAWEGDKLQERSHGESFLAVLRRRFAEIGVYFMDEPEAPLSFRSTLGLISLLDLMSREGSQVVVATHSPVLVSLPGATLFELGDWGIRRVGSYDDLDVVQNWKSFLEAPPRYLRHLLDD